MANFWQNFAGGFGRGYEYTEAMRERSESRAMREARMQALQREEEAMQRDAMLLDEYQGYEGSEAQRQAQSEGSSQGANALVAGMAKTASIAPPGSPERQLALSTIPAHPEVKKYLAKMDPQAAQSLAKYVQDNPDIGLERLQGAAADPGQFTQLLQASHAQSIEHRTDPQAYGFKQRMMALNRQTGMLEAKQDRLMGLFQQLSPDGASQKMVERQLGIIQDQLAGIERTRNNLSSPQYTTMARGEEQVTGYTDPATGEFVETALAESPVYVRERGAMQRQAQSLAQQESQFSRAEAGRMARFRAGEEAEMSRFEVAEANKYERATEKASSEERAMDEGLREEFNRLPEVNAYKTIVPVVQSAREAVKRNSAAADLNIVYAAAKVMDPGSVVRESEVDMAIGTGSPAQKYLGLWNYINGGGRLTPKVRRQLLAEINSRAKSQESLYKSSLDEYKTGAPQIGSIPLLSEMSEGSEGSEGSAGSAEGPRVIDFNQLPSRSDMQPQTASTEQQFRDMMHRAGGG